MKVIDTSLPEVKLLQTEIYRDQRGCFLEAYRQNDLCELGLPKFTQDNISYSQRNVVRGLHYQLEPAQAKLVRVTQGRIFDVAVDIRPNSVTFGKWVGFELNDENHFQLYIPVGFAHGFSVLSENACVYYKCSSYYQPKSEYGIRYNDPQLGIDWQIEGALLSEKDANLPRLKEVSEKLLPAKS
jgi:dTDP-4-dehydrorhamnose 3,5-epimerase